MPMIQQLLLGLVVYLAEEWQSLVTKKVAILTRKILRNFGMPRPEGFRKAQRIMALAERYGLPLVTFIDTPGAYPGVDAEERGQSEAIARSISLMAGLQVPFVSVIIGEGGSGGALAIGVCDRLFMLGILRIFCNFSGGLRFDSLEEYRKGRNSSG